MKKIFTAFYTSVLTACLCGMNLTASAYTADDVAAKARSAGWPETLIQTGYNQWASGEYSQAQLDEAYNSVSEYNEQTEEFIYNSFGIDPDEARQKIAEDEAKKNSESQSESESQAVAETQPETKSDKYISDSEFINMSMEQKQEYVSSLPAEDKTEFISELSQEARNSIIKQLPTEEKVAIMQKYIDTANTMGMNVTVDSITEKDISVTVRNNDGIVIDKAEVGVVIDETGISHTKPLTVAGIGLLISAVGFGGLYWYIKHTEQDS